LQHFISLLLLLSALAASAIAADGPQWHGPARDGTVFGGEWPGTLVTTTAVAIMLNVATSVHAARTGAFVIVRQ
jgi:hypothetical protein